MNKFYNQATIHALPRRVFSVLLLAGLLSTGTHPLPTIALSHRSHVAQTDSRLHPDPVRLGAGQRQVVRRVRQDLARRANVPRGRLRVVEIRRATWTDGCLGAANPGEVCTQAIVEGWRVQLTDSRQTWTYHTDATGAALRLMTAAQPAPAGGLPQPIANLVLQAAARQAKLPLGQLRIAQAEQRTWDGCLGIRQPGILCTQIAISGWRVVVTSGQQRWVYHTNQDGSDLRLNEAESQIGMIAPTQIPVANRPAPLERGVLFRAITSGGFAGITTQITLYEDGRVETIGRSPQTRTIAPEAVDRFRQLLSNQQFAQFNNLNYPAPNGAADYFTVLLIGQNGVTQYADIIQTQLPIALKQIIQTWSSITSS